MKSKLNPNTKPWYPQEYYDRQEKIRQIKTILTKIIPTKMDCVRFQGGAGSTPIQEIKKGNFDPKFKLNQTDNRY